MLKTRGPWINLLLRTERVYIIECNQITCFASDVALLGPYGAVLASHRTQAACKLDRRVGSNVCLAKAVG